MNKPAAHPEMDQKFQMQTPHLRLSDTDPMKLDSLLIVEDNPDDVLMLKKHLERAGITYHREVVLATGRETIDCINQNHFDLIIMDFALPDMTARDIIETLKEDNPARHIPCIALTIRDDRALAIELMKLGVYDYICKNDITAELLLDSVKYVRKRYHRDQYRETHLAKLARQVLYDRLTGLPNRNLFYDRISQTISHADRQKSKFSVLFADLDGFKAINDLYGHLTGDEVLIAVSRRMSHIFRGTDTIARYGGDEFVAVLPDVQTFEDAQVVAKKLEMVALDPVRIKGMDFQMKVSIGIAIYPEDGKDLNEIIDYADRAMYEIKRQRRSASD